MKYTANIISITRIFLALLLILFNQNQIVFVVIYLLCGFSDVLDGYIARKTNTQSAIGAKIDSVADFVMFCTIIVILIIWVGDGLIAFLPWLVAVFLIRIVNIIIAARKYHTLVMLHTWGNKITGFLVFLTPLLFVVTNNTAIFLLICIVAIISALEESIIHLTSDLPDLNRKSIFI